MKLLYSNVIEQNKGWGAEWFLNQAFHATGVETQTIDYRAHRFSLPFKFFFSKPFEYFLLQRGDRFPLEILDTIKTPKFFWASELVSRRRDQDRLFQYKKFDHVFVRGHACKSIITQKGWTSEEKISILLSAFDPAIFNKQEVKKDIDVLFVGSLTPRRKEILSKLQNITVTKAYGLELSKLINRSKIVLNIHAENFLDTETRVFEVLGSGSFLLTERLATENPFKEGIHLVESDIHEFEKNIQYYLEHEDEREKIALQGYAEAHAHHTYVHRAKYIETLFKKFPPAAQKISFKVFLYVPSIIVKEILHRLY